MQKEKGGVRQMLRLAITHEGKINNFISLNSPLKRLVNLMIQSISDVMFGFQL